MLLHSKHQKLILQCYPPGKAVDKKPNPSELSYLLYYASTRRVKLEKVFKFILQRTAADVNRSRSGNLQVTLGIVSALIDKCSDNVNVFANDICLILLLIIKVKDIALSKSVLITYADLCKHLDAGLFTGDIDFIEQFKQVSKQLINVTPAASSSSDTLDWKLISISACNHITSCLAYNSKLAKFFIGICIPLCVDMIKKGNNEQQLKNRLKNNMDLTRVVLASQQSPSQLQPSQSRAQTQNQTQAALADGETTEQDVEEAALDALKSYFDTLVISQITVSSRALVEYCYLLRENEWGRALLRLCTTWVPVQLRYVILSTLLDVLTTESDKDFMFHIEGANYVLSLVSSNINMIGLSVSDVIQQLLTLQSRAVTGEHNKFEEPQILELVHAYTECICNIATYVYYFDQVPDSIQEIIYKINSTMAKAAYTSAASANHTAFATASATVGSTGELSVAEKSSSNFAEGSLAKLILYFLNDIEKILAMLKQKPSTITRNHVKLEHLEPALSIFSPESSFVGFDTTKITSTDLINIQSKFLKNFRDYLGHEFFSTEEVDDDDDDDADYRRPRLLDDEEEEIDSEIDDDNVREYRTSQRRKSVEFKAEARTFLYPNVNNYISNTDNFLTSFFAHLDLLIHSESCKNLTLARLVVETLADLINLLGINFLNNFIPLFFHWKEKTDKEYQNIRETIAYSTMHHILKVMDQQYHGSLEESNYARHSTFYHHVESDISYRRKQGTWVSEIDNTKLVVVDVNPKAGDLATRSELKAFGSNNAWLSLWINCDVDARKLLEEVFKRKTHPHAVQQQGTKERENGGLEDGANLQGNGIAGSPKAAHSADVFLTPTRTKPRRSFSYGLGNVNDIVSIHSGIILNTGFTKASGTANGGGSVFNGGITSSPIREASIHFDNRYVLAPKVADLKDVAYAQNKVKPPRSFFGERMQSSPGSAKSILSKQLIHKDVDSILDGLNSDDADIIV